LYQQLVGKRTKIVFQDGSNIVVVKGVLKQYDENIKTISLLKDSNEIVLINVAYIFKAEVLSDE